MSSESNQSDRKHMESFIKSAGLQKGLFLNIIATKKAWTAIKTRQSVSGNTSRLTLWKQWIQEIKRLLQLSILQCLDFSFQDCKLNLHRDT